MVAHLKQLSFFCTDRDQHAHTKLGSLVLDDRAGIVANDSVEEFGNRYARLRDESVWTDAEGRVHVRCQRCGRHLQWRQDRAIAVLKALDGHFADFDLSGIT